MTISEKERMYRRIGSYIAFTFISVGVSIIGGIGAGLVVFGVISLIYINFYY